MFQPLLFYILTKTQLSFLLIVIENGFTPLLLRGLRTKEDNEKNRKREKRNEIQCIIYVKSCLFVFILLKLCS